METWDDADTVLKDRICDFELVAIVNQYQASFTSFLKRHRGNSPTYGYFAWKNTPIWLPLLACISPLKVVR